MYNVSNEYELVPEKNFWDRTSPVSTLPRPISKYFIQVKHKFGIDIANLVIFAYREWGKDVAVMFAKKVLEFESFEELVRFLQARAKRIGEGREILNNMIYNFQYSHYLNQLLEIREKICSDSWELSTRIFHMMAGIGLFYSPECIGKIAEYEVGCRKTIPRKCERAFETYIKLKEKGEGG